MKKKKPYSWTWVMSRSLEWGIMQWECYIKSDPAPAGIAWIMACKIPGQKKPACLVMHSFVHKWARRRGVRTALHQEMRKSYCAIFTWTGTKDGLAWMKARGAKKTQAWGLWVYDMERKVRRKSKRKKRSRR